MKTPNIEISPDALRHGHLEFSVDKKEIEFYINGWFVMSCVIDELTPEAKENILMEDEQ